MVCNKILTLGVLGMLACIGVGRAASTFERAQDPVQQSVVQNEKEERENENTPMGATFIKVKVRQGHVVVTQDIEVNTLENFVKIDAPQIGSTYSAVTVFHDYMYNTGMTLAAFGHRKMCMLMDRYPDIPEDIGLFFSFKEIVDSIKYFDGNHMGRYKTHLYQIDPTPLNHTESLSPMMKAMKICPENMVLRFANMLTMEELSEESDYPVDDNAIVLDLLVLPYIPAKGERVKRAARRHDNHCHQCSQRFMMPAFI